MDRYVKAYAQEHDVTPVLMEDFFAVVFDDNWTSSDDDVEPVEPLWTSMCRTGRDPIGVFVKGKAYPRGKAQL